METDSSTTSDSDLESLFKINKRANKEKLNFSNCIICQQSGNLVESQELSKQKFIDSTAIRLSCGGDKFSTNLRIIYSMFNEIKCRQSLLWHKTCYSSYTSKRNIEFFKSKCMKTSIVTDLNKINVQPDEVSTKKTILRTHNFNIKKCIFCQKRKDSKLCQIMTTNIETKIKHIAKVNPLLHSRTGENDLIALELKYHSSCFVINWKKYTSKEKATCVKASECQNNNDICLNKLIDELKQGFSKGKAYGTDSIYDRFLRLGGDASTISKKIIINKIEKHFAGNIEKLKRAKQNEHSVLMPRVSKEEVIETYMDVCDDYKESLFSGSSELSELHKLCNNIKSKIREIPEYKDTNSLDNTEYKKYVPNNLYLLISLLVCDSPTDGKENVILSICQDIIYSCTNGTKQTPKHIGLGLTVHQETRSKKIIDALHACGHSVPYKYILQLRNTVAQNEIKLYEENDKITVPSQLVSNRFVQFAADNIDILEETLDKSPTFHGTQMAVFQRGPVKEQLSSELSLLPYKTKLAIPADFHSLESIKFNKLEKKKYSGVSPLIHDIAASNNKHVTQKNENLAWIFCRLHSSTTQEKVVPQWTGFNKLLLENRCTSNTTTYGYLPLIHHVASEYDTIWTVIKRCSLIAYKLHNKYTVITFDQAIYNKAKELQWFKPEETSNVIIRLGGFHIIMNFLKVIGQHMKNSGLSDVWLESGLYGEATIEGILNGKKYNKSIRAHKLTYESIFRIILPLFEKWLMDAQSDNINYVHLLYRMSGEVEQMIKEKKNIFVTFKKMSEIVSNFSTEFSEFVSSQSSTFKYWYSYLELVDIVLDFIYAERTGNWELHLSSFRKMLPWFFAYDHTNYSRWGTIYFLDMSNLENTAADVYQEYIQGNFVVKRLEGSFNQLSIDQALEHINKTSKDAGGIVGLTKNSTRLDEWFLSYNEIGNMIYNFRSSLNIKQSYSCQNIESGAKRILVDETSVCRLQEQLNRFNVFSRTDSSLLCISTNEVASKTMESSLLAARQTGEDCLKHFIKTIGTPDFHKPLKKNNIQSLKPVLKTVDVQKTLIQGQHLLQRILAVKEMGRQVNYEDIFRHELTEYPMALAPNGSLNTPTNKSALGHILESYITTSKELPLNIQKTCYIFDGMAAVQSIGRPADAKTFGDYSTTFLNIIFKNPYNVERIDVVMDNYQDISIKEGTRSKRSSCKTIDRVIDNPQTLLPQQWSSFIHSVFNKRQLTQFLSNVMYEYSLNRTTNFVTSGGFKNILQYKSNYKMKSDILESTHEEADTRILLHILSAKEEGYTRCIIDCKDTDVLVLLSYFKDLLTDEVWMKVGIKDNVRFIPVHALTLGSELLKNLPAFHSLTGCDTTSQFVGIGKKSGWKVYLQHYKLLDDVGVLNFNDDLFEKMHQFVINLYTDRDDVSSIDTLRGIMATSRTINNLPPTKDSLKEHCKRVHYQTKVWLNALISKPLLPSLMDNGWTNVNNKLSPILSTLPQVPEHKAIFTTCHCKKGCAAQCSCRKSLLTCIETCKCMGQSSSSCTNITTNELTPSCSDRYNIINIQDEITSDEDN